jgi:hypothetical protein
MDGSIIDIIFFAPVATILCVLLFWFIQLLFIQGQKYLLEKIRQKHEPFCRFTNFLGILFQTICHALGYTVTKSGISDIYVSVNYGKVAPKKQKKGIFEWISNAFLFIGPFFIPAFLLLICLFFLQNNGFDITTPYHLLELKYTFIGQLNIFSTNLYGLTSNFFKFLSNIDLFHPIHLGFLFALIFLGLGIRPSYFGEKKIDKIDILYDLKNIWQLITYKPIYLILLLLLGYSFFYISLLLDKGFYSTLFSIFGWISIISIVALFISYLIILFILLLDKIEGRKRIFPFITIPISYIFARILFTYLKTDLDKSLSLIIMIFFTIIVISLLMKSKDDKFKTKRKIKRLKNKSKGEEQDD